VVGLHPDEVISHHQTAQITIEPDLFFAGCARPLTWASSVSPRGGNAQRRR